MPPKMPSKNHLTNAILFVFQAGLSLPKKTNAILLKSCHCIYLPAPSPASPTTMVRGHILGVSLNNIEFAIWKNHYSSNETNGCTCASVFLFCFFKHRTMNYDVRCISGRVHSLT